MPFIEALKLALSAILGHKLRSFLTLLGVIFGVATVIVVVSLIEGFNSYVDEKIANIGTNAFSVSKYSIDDFSSVEALNAARRRNKDVTLDDAAALLARRVAIQDVGAKEDVPGDVKFGSINLFRVHISATTPNIAEIERVEVAEGRYFGQADQESRRNVTFIGADVSDKLFPTANPLGQTIRIDGRPFRRYWRWESEGLGLRTTTGHVRVDATFDVPCKLRFAPISYLERHLDERGHLRGRGGRGSRRNADADESFAERER